MSGSTVNKERVLNDVPKLEVWIILDSDLTTKFVITVAKLNIQQSERLIYMDVGPSIGSSLMHIMMIEWSMQQPNHQNDLLKCMICQLLVSHMRVANGTIFNTSYYVLR